jgi:hypothetical protein
MVVSFKDYPRIYREGLGKTQTKSIVRIDNFWAENRKQELPYRG